MTVEPWIVVLVIVGIGVAFYLAQHFGLIDLSDKSKSSGRGGGGIAGIGDEVFHPARHEAQVEMDRQSILPAPAPLPGDGDFGIYDGKLKIDLTERGKHYKSTE
ncbi:hypothetical protein GCM10007382_25480 [Salinibacterium xinjiangense]|uniref:Uncharacterized protein n=1 Tax=Salinibacterium xinjiangense TaxID=386302 RepID=A0A2C9A1J2_9MICO|nr:hypothetical protein GCM10007382_25480 [Salinibacterium xinjiangense]SOE72809.1 hypothetical protein SAMN06296378_2623 [Salinibacterium xinjiangense]